MATEMISAHDHIKFLGTSFINRMDEVVLRIGATRQYTRTEMVQKVGVGNIAAAQKLSTVLRKAGIKSPEQLYTLDPRELALIRGLGETTIFVVMAILRSEGFDVHNWYKSALGARSRAVTFRTMKLNREQRRRRR